ncbi:hypothetical protein [Bradyrhizobium sp. I1.7.5]|uniref:hypothetical protein n=1 Tax=Bradyrhizobium sp. I1.7.5 TaxID=3156363 RepID=UPI00339AAF5E
MSGLIDRAANLPRVRRWAVPSSIGHAALQDADEIRPAELWIELNVEPSSAAGFLDYVRIIKDSEGRKKWPKERQAEASELEKKPRKTSGSEKG